MTTDPFTFVLTAYLVMAAVMVGLWVLQLRVRNASIVDVGWCAGLIAVVLWYATQAIGETERKMLVAALAVLYAGRLGFYVLLNRVIGKTEDARYRRLREQWGSSEPVRMFGYFQVQALAVTAFSIPFLVLIQNPRPPFRGSHGGLAARAIPIQVVESRQGLSRWTLALFTPSELFL
jgi:steroid 5-alpha reductase family enzyme